MWSILLYGCESWTLDKDIERRIEAAEMWFLRRILRISWTEKVKNGEVLRSTDGDKETRPNNKKETAVLSRACVQKGRLRESSSYR